MAPARGVGTLLGLLVVLVGCAGNAPPAPGLRSMRDLVFLTRDGCVNTTTMRARLDDALRALGLPLDYQFVDADTLADLDPRGAYGTPTVLHSGRDLFGMDQPPSPHALPT